MTLRSIGDLYGTSRQNVDQFLRYRNIHVQLTSKKDIASELNVSRQTIYTLTKQNSLSGTSERLPAETCNKLEELLTKECRYCGTVFIGGLTHVFCPDCSKESLKHIYKYMTVESKAKRLASIRRYTNKKKLKSNTTVVSAALCASQTGGFPSHRTASC